MEIVDSGNDQKSIAEDVQAVTRNSVEVAFVTECYSSEQLQAATKASGIELIVVNLPEAKKGLVLLPRRLAPDSERPPQVLRSLHFLALAILIIAAVVECITSFKEKYRPANYLNGKLTGT